VLEIRHNDIKSLFISQLAPLRDDVYVRLTKADDIKHSSSLDKICCLGSG